MMWCPAIEAAGTPGRTSLRRARACNHRKGGKGLDEVRFRLQRPPFEPRSDVYSVFVPYLEDQRNEAWRDYLFLGRN